MKVLLKVLDKPYNILLIFRKVQKPFCMVCISFHTELCRMLSVSIQHCFIIYFFRTKWKRQTQVGLELLAEAGNYAAVQRMLQTHPYWGAYMGQAMRPLAAGVDPSAFLRYSAPPRANPPGSGVYVPGLMPNFHMSAP